MKFLVWLLSKLYRQSYQSSDYIVRQNSLTIYWDYDKGVFVRVYWGRNKKLTLTLKRGIRGNDSKLYIVLPLLFHISVSAEQVKSNILNGKKIPFFYGLTSGIHLSRGRLMVMWRFYDSEFSQSYYSNERIKKIGSVIDVFKNNRKECDIEGCCLVIDFTRRFKG